MIKRNKINVLLCSPYADAIGGISRWTGHILNYYSEIESSIKLKHFYSKGRMVYSNTPLLYRVFIGISSYIPFLKGLKKELNKEKFAVVHFTSSASFGLIRDVLALRIAKNKGISSIIHFRFGRIPEIYKQRNWEYRLIDIVIRKADKVIVIDQLSYDTLVGQGYNHILILPNPLTPKVQEFIDKNSPICREDRKILFAGHIVTGKGIFELIKSCKDIPDIKVSMIGYVSEVIKSQLYSLAGEGSEKWLDIAGEKDFETTIKEMLSASLFVLPTYTEGFPNVIIESMACGCPIVSTKVGAIPEMLDIENGDNYGLCVEPKNIDQLRSAILRMLNDREFALKCGKNAQIRVNKLYSMPIIWNQLESIWYSFSNQ